MNAQFDGGYYDAQHRDGRYATVYAKTPPATIAMNAYSVALVAAIMGLERGARVLDLGSGSGLMVAAWRDAGYDAYGLEISETAVARNLGVARTTVRNYLDGKHKERRA